jgi:hypothetical protein
MNLQRFVLICGDLAHPVLASFDPVGFYFFSDFHTDLFGDFFSFS